MRARREDRTTILGIVVVGHHLRQHLPDLGDGIWQAYGHLNPKNSSDSMALLPRFADLFPAVSQAIEVAEAPAEPCVTGTSLLVP